MTGRVDERQHELELVDDGVVVGEEEAAKSGRPSPAELLATPGAYMHRTDFRELGFERRAVDAIFRECPIIKLPGYDRPIVVSDAVRALLDGCTYCDRCGDRVRPT